MAALIEKPRCPKCGSTNVYTRSKTNDRRCQTCGAITPIVSGESHAEAGPEE